MQILRSPFLGLLTNFEFTHCVGSSTVMITPCYSISFSFFVLLNVNLKIVKRTLLYKNLNRRFGNAAFFRVYKTKYR